VIGLGWGVLSLAGYVVQALTRTSFAVSPEVSTVSVSNEC
jgi:hypothetical protein